MTEFGDATRDLTAADLDAIAKRLTEPVTVPSVFDNEQPGVLGRRGTAFYHRYVAEYARTPCNTIHDSATAAQHYCAPSEPLQGLQVASCFPIYADHRVFNSAVAVPSN